MALKLIENFSIKGMDRTLSPDLISPEYVYDILNFEPELSEFFKWRKMYGYTLLNKFDNYIWFFKKLYNSKYKSIININNKLYIYDSENYDLSNAKEIKIKDNELLLEQKRKHILYYKDDIIIFDKNNVYKTDGDKAYYLNLQKPSDITLSTPNDTLLNYGYFYAYTYVSEDGQESPPSVKKFIMATSPDGTNSNPITIEFEDKSKIIDEYAKRLRIYRSPQLSSGEGLWREETAEQRAKINFGHSENLSFSITNSSIMITIDGIDFDNLFSNYSSDGRDFTFYANDNSTKLDCYIEKFDIVAKELVFRLYLPSNLTLNHITQANFIYLYYKDDAKLSDSNRNKTIADLENTSKLIPTTNFYTYNTSDDLNLAFTKFNNLEPNYIKNPYYYIYNDGLSLSNNNITYSGGVPKDINKGSLFIDQKKFFGISYKVSDGDIVPYQPNWWNNIYNIYNSLFKISSAPIPARGGGTYCYMNNLYLKFGFQYSAMDKKKILPLLSIMFSSTYHGAWWNNPNLLYNLILLVNKDKGNRLEFYYMNSTLFHEYTDIFNTGRGVAVIKDNLDNEITINVGDDYFVDLIIDKIYQTNPSGWFNEFDINIDYRLIINGEEKFNGTLPISMPDYNNIPAIGNASDNNDINGVYQEIMFGNIPAVYQDNYNFDGNNYFNNQTYSFLGKGCRLKYFVENGNSGDLQKNKLLLYYLYVGNHSSKDTIINFDGEYASFVNSSLYSVFPATTEIKGYVEQNQNINDYDIISTNMENMYLLDEVDIDNINYIDLPKADELLVDQIKDLKEYGNIYTGEIYNNRLFVVDGDDRNILRFSNAYSLYELPTNNYFEFLDQEKIVSLKTYKQYLFIITNKKTYVLNGDDLLNFKIEEYSNSINTISNDYVVYSEDGIIVLCPEVGIQRINIYNQTDELSEKINFYIRKNMPKLFKINFFKNKLYLHFIDELVIVDYKFNSVYRSNYSILDFDIDKDNGEVYAVYNTLLLKLSRTTNIINREEIPKTIEYKEVNANNIAVFKFSYSNDKIISNDVIILEITGDDFDTITSEYDRDGYDFSLYFEEKKLNIYIQEFDITNKIIRIRCGIPNDLILKSNENYYIYLYYNDDSINNIDNNKDFDTFLSIEHNENEGKYTGDSNTELSKINPSNVFDIENKIHTIVSMDYYSGVQGTYNYFRPTDISDGTGFDNSEITTRGHNNISSFSGIPAYWIGAPPPEGVPPSNFNYVSFISGEDENIKMLKIKDEFAGYRCSVPSSNVNYLNGEENYVLKLIENFATMNFYYKLLQPSIDWNYELFYTSPLNCFAKMKFHSYGLNAPDPFFIINYLYMVNYQSDYNNIIIDDDSYIIIPQSSFKFGIDGGGLYFIYEFTIFVNATYIDPIPANNYVTNNVLVYKTDKVYIDESSINAPQYSFKTYDINFGYLKPVIDDTFDPQNPATSLNLEGRFSIYREGQLVYDYNGSTINANYDTSRVFNNNDISDMLNYNGVGYLEFAFGNVSDFKVLEPDKNGCNYSIVEGGGQSSYFPYFNGNDYYLPLLLFGQADSFSDLEDDTKSHSFNKSLANYVSPLNYDKQLIYNSIGENKNLSLFYDQLGNIFDLTGEIITREFKDKFDEPITPIKFSILGKGSEIELLDNLNVSYGIYNDIENNCFYKLKDKDYKKQFKIKFKGDYNFKGYRFYYRDRGGSNAE